MTILDDILAKKQQELQCSSGALSANRQRKKSSLRAAVTMNPSALIAEIKPSSPIEGVLLERNDVPTFVSLYHRYAHAMSVLTDRPTFGGGFDLLAEVRSQTDLPLLAKDFFTRESELLAAEDAGADAVLLILAVLSDERLGALFAVAFDRGLEVVLELHDDTDAQRAESFLQRLSAAEQGRVLLGINNRNVRTQLIDLGTTARIAPRLRQSFPTIPIVAESGIRHRTDLRRLAHSANGFLIGTSVLRSEDPDTFLQSLRRPFLKFCGITRAVDVQNAETFGADFLGFVLVPGSPRFLAPPVAAELRSLVRSAGVVVVLEDAHDMADLRAMIRPDFFQLYDDRGLSTEDASTVIRAYRGVPSLQTLTDAFERYPFILIDKPSGCDHADFAAIKSLPASLRSRMFLAGGCTPENVASVMFEIRPFAVDCARGIESSPGIKDPARMAAFTSSLLP